MQGLQEEPVCDGSILSKALNWVTVVPFSWAGR